MKKYTLLFLLFYLNNVFGQKTPLKLESLGKWPIASSAIFSGDGNFLSFTVNNRNLGRNELHINSIDGTLQKVEYDVILRPFFSSDNKTCVFLKKDTLKIFSLVNRRIKNINNVSKVTISPNNRWLAFSDASDRKLTLKDLESNSEKTLENINTYVFSPNSEYLLVVCDTLGQHNIKIVNLLNINKTEEIDISANGFIYDAIKFDTAQNLTFVKKTVNMGRILICIYDLLSKKLKEYELSDKTPKGFVGDFADVTFNNFMKTFIFSLKKVDTATRLKTMSKVDIWHYLDPKLQTEQLAGLKKQEYLFSFNINNGRFTQLEFEDEHVISDKSGESNYLLLVKRYGDSEWYWNSKNLSTIILKRIDGGDSVILKSNFQAGRVPYFKFSPTQKFVIYYDPDKAAYFTFEINTHRTKNITRSIKAQWTNSEDEDLVQSKYHPVGMNCWLRSETQLILRDRYDLWNIDPLGKRKPICITQGLGTRNRTIFYIPPSLHAKSNFSDTLILYGYNRRLKISGFYRASLNGKFSVKVLYKNKNYKAISACFFNNKKWYYFITEESEVKPRNYFYTSDFKNIAPVSHFFSALQQKYIWLTSSIHHWKSKDGNWNSGVLFVPENFDVKKKYPIIFHYYERNEVNPGNYLYPNLSIGKIDIPYFVSNGYLVFVPDFTYKIGSPGQSALNILLSATRYLSEKSYINQTKMGLQGHSWGGYETNFFITHSNAFAAAVSCEGDVNLTSKYGELRNNGTISNEYLLEVSQSRLGTTPWRNKNTYIKSSPIFFINNVRTPLLMMNNLNDDNVLFSQGLQLYLGLRRENKPVWMLQYDEGGHSLGSDIDGRDFTIRLRQFFDHYLKLAPAPLWMTQGIPAKFKGLITGYELNPNGHCGEDCKICQQWNQRWKKNPEKVKIAVQEWSEF